VTFTKPGLGTTEMKLNSAVEGINKLKGFETYIEQNKIPLNSVVAMAVEAIGTDGDIFTDVVSARIKFNISEEDGLLESFKVYEVYGEANSTDTWGGQEVFDGQTLSFDESGGRKVFRIEAGPVEGKFTITFSDVNEAGIPPVTREFEVTRQLVEAVCSTTDPTACVTEAECTAVDGVWDPATTSCGTKDVTGCSAENPSACTDQASCVATGVAVYLEGYTNVTDGCYGLPHEVDQVVSRHISLLEDGSGKVDNATAEFAGGVLVGDSFVKIGKLSGKDVKDTTIAYTFKPRSEDVGKSAQLLAIVGIEMPASADDPQYDGVGDVAFFSFSEFVGDFYPVNLSTSDWKAEVEKMRAKPYLSNITVKDLETVVLVPGDFAGPEVSALLEDAQLALYFFVGYMLDDGMIVFNFAPASIQIEPSN
jgi:hypothetical protein